MKTVLRLLFTCSVILTFWGCSSFPSFSKKSVAKSEVPLLFGEWNGAHEIPSSNYKRTWTVVYQKDGTYSSVHRVFLGGNPPRESKSSGYWRVDGDKYSERIGGIDARESFYEVKASGTGILLFKRSDGYSFKLERLK